MVYNDLLYLCQKMSSSSSELYAKFCYKHILYLQGFSFLAVANLCAATLWFGYSLSVERLEFSDVPLRKGLTCLCFSTVLVPVPVWFLKDSSSGSCSAFVC